MFLFINKKCGCANKRTSQQFKNVLRILKKKGCSDLDYV